MSAASALPFRLDSRVVGQRGVRWKCPRCLLRVGGGGDGVLPARGRLHGLLGGARATQFGRRLRSGVTQRTESARMWSDHQAVNANGPCRREKGGSPTFLTSCVCAPPLKRQTRLRPAAAPVRARCVAGQASSRLTAPQAWQLVQWRGMPSTWGGVVVARVGLCASGDGPAGRTAVSKNLKLNLAHVIASHHPRGVRTLCTRAQR